MLADLTGDMMHKRLTRWTLNRLNVEMESWSVQREFEELSSEYQKMTHGKGDAIGATFTFQDYIGKDFFTPLDAEWK